MAYPPGITHSQVVEALRVSRSRYPNTSAIAYFRPNSLTLHFEQLSREEYAGMSQRGVSSIDRPHVETVAHEITHWSDQVSSVWGQEYLIKVFEAHAAARANREEGYYRVVELFDEERRILLPLYYHVVEKDVRPHNVEKRWRIDFSAGHEFTSDGKVNESRPLFFVRFADNETREPIARQPITVGALLETTATWSELRAGLGIISSLPDDERLVEQPLWTKERQQVLYEPHLTVYTAPAHMLANFSGIPDVLQTYERGAALANVALNLSGEIFDTLRHPESFATFGERQVAFVLARNRGYAFAVLARHAAGVDNELPLQSWLATILDRAGLPAYDNIMQAAYVRLEKLSRGLPIRSEMDLVRDYILGVGRDRFLRRTASEFRGGSFDPLGEPGGPMPPMFDCNTNLFWLGDHHLDQAIFDPEKMHYAEMELRGFTTNFLQACRGFEVYE